MEFDTNPHHCGSHRTEAPMPGTRSPVESTKRGKEPSCRKCIQGRCSSCWKVHLFPLTSQKCCGKIWQTSTQSTFPFPSLWGFFFGTNPHFIYGAEANKVEILPVAGGGDGDPHTTRFPGVLSKHKTQVKGLMTKLSFGTGQPWFHLPGERGREEGQLAWQSRLNN